MIQHLDDDSMIYMLHFMELSDIVENLALVNTKCFNFLNIENDHQGSITNLLIEKLFFSEEINLAQLLYRLEKVLCLDSIMNDAEKQIINYDILKSIFISSSEENFMNQFKKRWREIFKIESYAKLKVCMDFGKRLCYLDLFCIKKDVPQPRLAHHEFELLYRVDLEDFEEYTETNTIYKEFLTLAKDYELSHDKIYKFRLICNNKQLQVAKYFSKKREIEREKDILLKYYTYVYNHHTQRNEFQYTGGELDTLVLSHQESVENNVLLSTWDIQSSKTYSLSSYTTQRGDVFLTFLNNANQFFHSFTNPFKCGDLRYSKKRGDIQLWTISRKDIKNLTTPYLIYPLLFLPLVIYIASKCTNDKPIEDIGHFLILLSCDAAVMAFISVLSVDQLCNRFRKMDAKDYKLFSAISCGFMVLKAFVSYLNSPTPFHTFMSTFQDSIPTYIVLMPYGYGSFHYFKILFWYIRCTDWFYQHVAIRQENIIFKGLRKCFDWITNYFSLKSVDNDSPTRCAIN